MTTKIISNLYLVEFVDKKTDTIVEKLRFVLNSEIDFSIEENFENKLYLANLLLQISRIENTIDIRPSSIDLVFIDNGKNYLDQVIQNNQNYKIKIYFHMSVKSTYSIKEKKFLCFVGNIDSVTIVLDIQGKKILIRSKDTLVEVYKNTARHYTDIEQKDKFPDDNGLEFQSDTTDSIFRWGKEI